MKEYTADYTLSIELEDDTPEHVAEAIFETIMDQITEEFNKARKKFNIKTEFAGRLSFFEDDGDDNDYVEDIKLGLDID